MSEQELWAAIRELQEQRQDQDARLDELEQWLERVAQSAEMTATVSIQTLRLIQSQIQIARGRNENN